METLTQNTQCCFPRRNLLASSQFQRNSTLYHSNQVQNNLSANIEPYTVEIQKLNNRAGDKYFNNEQSTHIHPSIKVQHSALSGSKKIRYQPQNIYISIENLQKKADDNFQSYLQNIEQKNKFNKQASNLYNNRRRPQIHRDQRQNKHMLSSIKSQNQSSKLINEQNQQLAIDNDKYKKVRSIDNYKSRIQDLKLRQNNFLSPSYIRQQSNKKQSYKNSNKTKQSSLSLKNRNSSSQKKILRLRHQTKKESLQTQNKNTAELSSYDPYLIGDIQATNSKTVRQAFAQNNLTYQKFNNNNKNTEHQPQINKIKGINRLDNKNSMIRLSQEQRKQKTRQSKASQKKIIDKKTLKSKSRQKASSVLLHQYFFGATKQQPNNKLGYKILNHIKQNQDKKMEDTQSKSIIFPIPSSLRLSSSVNKQIIQKNNIHQANLKASNIQSEGKRQLNNQLGKQSRIKIITANNRNPLPNKQVQNGHKDRGLQYRQIRSINKYKHQGVISPGSKNNARPQLLKKSPEKIETQETSGMVYHLRIPGQQKQKLKQNPFILQAHHTRSLNEHTDTQQVSIQKTNSMMNANQKYPSTDKQVDILRDKEYSICSNSDQNISKLSMVQIESQINIQVDDQDYFEQVNNVKNMREGNPNMNKKTHYVLDQSIIIRGDTPHNSNKPKQTNPNTQSLKSINYTNVIYSSVGNYNANSPLNYNANTNPNAQLTNTGPSNQRNDSSYLLRAGSNIYNNSNTLKIYQTNTDNYRYRQMANTYSVNSIGPITESRNSNNNMDLKSVSHACGYADGTNIRYTNMHPNVQVNNNTRIYKGTIASKFNGTNSNGNINIIYPNTTNSIQSISHTKNANQIHPANNNHKDSGNTVTYGNSTNPSNTTPVSAPTPSANNNGNNNLMKAENTYRYDFTNIYNNRVVC